MKGLITLLVIVFVAVATVGGFSIDNYQENSGTASSNYFCACTDVNQTCIITSAGQNVSVGNHRSEIFVPIENGVNWQIGCNGDPDYISYCNNGLSCLTGCPVTGCVGNYGSGGQLALATPPSSRAILYNIWDGGCASTFNNINYVGLNGVDLTDGGVSDSFNINIGKVDLEAVLTVYVWTDATRGSFANFDPRATADSANANGAYQRTTLTFAQAFQQLNGTVGPANFENVGAVALEVLGSDALDLIIALVETAGVLTLQKGSNLTTDAGVIGVAEPSDVVTYNLTISYQSLGLPVQNVYLWDDPTRNFKLSPANYFPYFSLVPGSLIVTTFDIDSITGALTPANYSYTEINGPNVLPNFNRIVLFLGNVSEFTYYNVFFAIRIPTTLPCCLPTCRANCGINAGNEPCYCIANTAYFCENEDGTALNFTAADGSRPNFNSAFVDRNCGFSTVPANTNIGGATSFVPRITITPVYAPSSPYVAFTTPTPAASVAPGQQVCATFIVGNNGTRDTAAVVTLSYNSAYLTPSSTGSSPGFTCSGSSCVSGLNQYPALQTSTYTLCFNANNLTTCAPITSQFSASIAPNGCNSTSITGPTGVTSNGTEIVGSVPVSSCIDVSSADNTAVSSPTTISGTAVLSVASNFTNTAIAPSGTSVLTICYSNQGNTPSPSSTITVTIPSGVSASGSGWTVSGTSATYTVGTINPGTVCAAVPGLTITYTATVLTCQNANLNFPVLLNSFCGNASSSSTLQPTGNTAISLTKTAGAASVVPGASVTYTLTYTNNGTRQFDTVTLNDTVPANTVYTGTNGWVCTPNNNAGSVCTATFPANGATIPFQVTVNANTTCDVTSITNTATAQGYCAGPPVSFQTTVVTAVAPITVAGNPDFFITKVATDGNGNAVNAVQAAGQVTYVLSYGNRGQRISSATITEGPVSSPFTFVGPSTWSAPNAAGQRTVTVSNIAPGQTGNVTFIVSAANTLTTCLAQAVPNNVTIAPIAPCTDANTADNSASATVSVTGNVDLYIYFTNVSTYTIPTATTASLQFCYGNLGNSVANNASMTVNLPSGITAATANNNGFVVNGATVTYFIGDVAANQAATCRTLFVNLPTTLNCTDSSYNSTASITSSCNEVNITNNVTPYSFAVTATFDLYIALTQPANASVSQVSPQITYCITYGNNGAKTVTPVILYENLPTNTAFVASASDSRWVAAGNGVYTLNLGTVPANSNFNTCIAFTVSANLPISATQTSFTDSAYITNNGVCGPEVTLVNNNASVTTTITGNPDLFVLKTNNGASFFGTGAVTNSAYSNFTGNVVVYTISYGNNGQADAVNATVTENVPRNTVYDSANSNAAWSCADGAAALTTCTANVGRVPVAAGNAQGVVFGTLRFAVRATSYSGSVGSPALLCPQDPTQNLVSIAVASPQVDLNQGNNQANATTPFAGLPNLYVTKTAANPGQLYTAGSTILFNIGYGNNGVRQAVNAIVTDTIPEYTVFNAAASSPGFLATGGGVAGSNVSFSLGNVSPQQTGTLVLAVTLQSGFSANANSIQNCAEVSNNCFGGNETTLADNIACAAVNITGYFDLVLQKHGYCESILYTLNYENVGNIGAAEVYLKAYVPKDTMFDANNSAPGWICTADTPGSQCRFPVTQANLLSNADLDYLSPGASGSVNFAVTPYGSSMSYTYTLDASIDDNLTGDNLDPTPDNNYASVTVGFSGCAACDSCCPEVDQCCPDYTSINFGFGGVLDGLNTCS